MELIQLIAELDSCFHRNDKQLEGCNDNKCRLPLSVIPVKTGIQKVIE